MPIVDVPDNSACIATIEGKRRFTNLATDVAADVLGGTVCLDKKGNPEPDTPVLSPSISSKTKPS